MDADGLRKEQTSFFKKFGQMLTSGVPVVQSLEALAAEAATGPWKAFSEELLAAVRSGSDISGVVKRHPELISPSAALLLQAAELGGQLDKVCLNIAQGLLEGTLDVPTGDAATGVAQAAANEPEPVKALNQVLAEAFDANASDVHLEPTAEGGRVRLRIDGALKTVRTFPGPLYLALVSRIKIMANLDVAERRRPQDGRIVLKAKGREYDLRITTIPVVSHAGDQEAATLRILSQEVGQSLTLERAVSDPETRKKLADFMRRPNGMIVVSGPTGSGKTTVMYSMLREVASERLKVVSVEDPVEYLLDNVVQTPVSVKRGLTFPAALRAVLRCDPDVIMFGEIRDLETLEVGVQCALTGHLVLTTLHTESAPGAFKRIAEIGVPPWLVRDSVTLATSQRLVRCLCKHCRVPDESTGYAGLKLPPGTYYRAKDGGCPECHGMGYRRRMAIMELCEMNDAIYRELSKGASEDSLCQTARAEGMRTLLEDGLLRASQGLTSVEEVMRVARPK